MHNDQLTLLKEALIKIATPDKVIKAIMQGFDHWSSPPQSRSRAPAYGSLLGPDILLSTAYYEQFHQLGWFQLCLGRATASWAKTVETYHPSLKTFNKTNWLANLVTFLWRFTRNMWNH